MRAKIEIDDELMAEAMKVTGLRGRPTQPATDPKGALRRVAATKSTKPALRPAQFRFTFLT